MAEPYTNTPTFYKERRRIDSIFHASRLSDNLLAIDHGSLSEDAPVKFKNIINVLYTTSIIDSKLRDEMFKVIQERLMDLK